MRDDYLLYGDKLSGLLVADLSISIRCQRDTICAAGDGLLAGYHHRKLLRSFCNNRFVIRVEHIERHMWRKAHPDPEDAGFTNDLTGYRDQVLSYRGWR